MIEAVRWGVSVPLLAIATLALVANWSLVLAVIVTKRSGVSMLPVVGGVFGMVGLVVLPVKGAAVWAWAPLVLDPSGIPAIVMAVVFRLALRPLLVTGSSRTVLGAGGGRGGAGP